MLVEEGIVDPRAPLRDLSDELADVSERITPDHLTSHSSGLPLSLALDRPETTLDRAICRSGTPILGLGPRGVMEPLAQCSGWLSVTLEKTASAILYHDGGTAGSTSALYICPEKAAALAILSNNGVAAHLWASMKLSWSNQLRQAHDHFTCLRNDCARSFLVVGQRAFDQQFQAVIQWIIPAGTDVQRPIAIIGEIRKQGLKIRHYRRLAMRVDRRSARFGQAKPDGRPRLGLGRQICRLPPFQGLLNFADTVRLSGHVKDQFANIKKDPPRGVRKGGKGAFDIRVLDCGDGFHGAFIVSPKVASLWWRLADAALV